MKSSGSKEKKVIRLSDHSSSAASGPFTNEPSNKRSAAAAAVEDDKNPSSKRIHLDSSGASPRNQGVGTNNTLEQSKVKHHDSNDS